MRRVPVIVVSVGIALGGILLALVVIASDDRRLFSLADRLLQWTTPYRLILENGHLRWRQLTIEADSLRIEPTAGDSAPLLAVEALHYSTTIQQLLSGMVTGGDFHARSLTLYLDEHRSAAPPTAGEILRTMLMLPQRTDIDTLHLVSRGETIRVVPVSHISALREANGDLRALAQARIGPSPVVVEMRLTPRNLESRQPILDIRARLSGPDDSSAMTVNGAAIARDESLRYDLSIDGEYERIGDFLRALDPQAPAPPGTLRIAGGLQGSVDDFVLMLDELTIDDPGRYHLDLRGQVRGIAGTSPAIDAIATGEISDADVFDQPPLTLLPKGSRTRMTLKLGGTLSEPVASELNLSFRERNLNLTLQDRGQPLPLRSDRRSSEVLKLRIAAQGPDTRDLGTLLQRELPADGPWSLTADLEVAGTQLTIPAFKTSLTLHEQDRLTIEGSLEDLRLPTPEGDAGAIGALDLIAHWEIADLTAVSATVKRSLATSGPLPARGQLTIQGGIAELRTMAGLQLALTLSELELGRGTHGNNGEHLSAHASGSATLSRAQARWSLQDISLNNVLPTGELSVTGSAQLQGSVPSADLQIAAKAAERSLLPWPTPLPISEIHARLRVRERYATLLGELTSETNHLQAILSAELDAGELRGLVADLYAPTLALDDVAPGFQEHGDRRASIRDEIGDGDPAEKTDWRARLPQFPLQLSLRLDGIQAGRSGLQSLALVLEANNAVFLLRQADATYAGGVLELRGVLDASGPSPQISVAGRGSRFPLGALLRDLGIAYPASGDLSLRGGLSSNGSDRQAVLAALDGRLALALADVEIRGAAYDLLMSDLLAWLVAGADQPTTRFDCAMAQFDVRGGIAHSDTLYLETPRMLASGEAAIDFPGDRLTLRLEPRSRSRSLQFPSAVSIEGPLTAPRVQVSPLQTTFDASARALMLLPELTLQLFGISGRETGLREPCSARLQ